ncbi:lipopolysaccharide transport periplasmic protein LptA [uncultured Helicobacter sp.]|uniref:lipopolysaccharide transport periplasmic protein LptA n=1 Tax=uncultured Helicobacter sp. TaxID=175537 RepID=UPI001F9F7256|nr:lipopolysaccharide transport periplasmic protein LptA [uncultured Helicobacter sp.]HIY43713.1 lipopolysaccharide transport periplasmic protein LptA [Candidatus Helicobacter avistercoris]
MVRAIILSFFLASSFYASELLEVSADKIYANQEKGYTQISGNVVILKGSDVLRASEVIIKTDKNRKPTFYDAKGNVTFKITLEDKRIMRGKAQNITYDTIKSEYRLKGKAFVQEEGKANALKGEEIVLNTKSGYASIVGNKSKNGEKKPAKITFSIDDIKKESKKK